ncbi:hypothetical protein A3D11_02675 [Candidatus Peribacteria bacterium RIFCSPHIGHO2_02_FULL_49_16]|nr:MAG: hypothetical protein A2880_01885 [Candidatus Peribacteria bacterium RIFCSPHIGHO2_01_FULL_49_38]OGJ58499.1 MAG: hypothetical protein A3D11_02675 [Candidatus Peribacteria bacterium RIFCSPHIGHO2_02_FULL_49_16]
MQVRFTMQKSIPVLDEHSSEVLGTVEEPLIHPDTGKIEGFFITTGGWFSPDIFLPTSHIVRWGKYVWVRDGEALGPLRDIIRLQMLFDEGRHVLGQPIVTEEGRMLGVCRDVQFHTQFFLVQWLFPRRFLWWGTPIPMNAVTIITQQSIVVRKYTEEKSLSVTKEVVLPASQIEPA